MINLNTLNIEKNDVIIITVGTETTQKEAYSILTNVKNELKNKKIDNLVIITTPNIRLSTLNDDELDQIGLKRK